MDTRSLTDCTVNRELSWLAFDRRVLEEATAPARGPFDRLSFLGIFLNNLDEFYRVRVGALRDRVAEPDPPRDDKTGWTPAEQLDRIETCVADHLACAAGIAADLANTLREQGPALLRPEDLSGACANLLHDWFRREIKPLLTPIVADAHHPFPFLRDRSAAVLTVLGDHLLGVIPLGTAPEFNVFHDSAGEWALSVADAVRAFAPQLFGRFSPRESCICRVTRSADLPVEEREDEGDFRGVMRDFVLQRRRLAPVRVQFFPRPSHAFVADVVVRLVHSGNAAASACPVPVAIHFVDDPLPLLLSPALAFHLAKRAPHAVPDGYRIGATAVPALPAWGRGDIAARIRRKDRLLRLPFESVEPFLSLLDQAASDPDVTAIRITLYRLAGHSRIVDALERAAENGKDVLCVLELRARFDEENNINYSEKLQRAGCTVIYGPPDRKVHAKVCLILYHRPSGPAAITQIGTGNYNEDTARHYTDLQYFTADPRIARDALRLFRALCIGEVRVKTDLLWIAPDSFLPRLLAELDREIAAARAGRPAAFLKVNSFNNITLIRKLIEASNAGVKIELHVRGICCLRPGVAGRTDNITVTAFIGTYLEHARILSFGTRGRERIYIGSGDFLNRNFNRRVEVFTPVLDATCRRALLAYIRALRSDKVHAWHMQPDGTYVR